MKQSDKLKVLIDSIKTANEMMRKQIEINGRAVELLGEFITEPETLKGVPFDESLPPLSTQVMVGQVLESEIKGEYKEIPIGVVGKDGKVEHHIRPDAMYKDIYLLGGVPKDDKTPACLDGKGDVFIKPKDMKAGEWYVKTRGDDDFMFKFKDFDSLDMNPIAYYILVNPLGEIRYNDTTSYSPSQTTLRKATQEEILKYFPNELEVPTHGGNDAAYIQEVTDPQV